MSLSIKYDLKNKKEYSIVKKDMVIKYEDTKIYKIYSHLGDKIYVGSTTKTLLSQRMAKHRSSYKRWKSGKHNFTSSYILFDEYGVENCIIELLEAQPCMNNDEKNKLEGKFIQELICVNKNVSGRTKKEYYEDNKEDTRHYFKQYREQNRDKQSEYMKQYNKDNRDTLRDKKKEYRENNKDKIREQRKQYYEENKEKLSDPHICECGGSYSHGHVKKHLRTLKHKQYLETLTNI
jgi:hypothetical protein